MNARQPACVTLANLATMKTRHWVPLTALALLATACERKSESDTALANQVAELERKSSAALERQQELERELENQKLAAERDAIERERLLIEEARLELEQKQSENATAEAAALLQREKDLASREGKVELLQNNIEEKNSKLEQRETELSERDRQLAGREAIALRDQDANDDTAPAGDYGMFYDRLSSYGSWFDSPDYGYVWQPVIVSDRSWRPYTRGRWACSDQGWTWISDEPFGWATYHYGRWALCRNRGWIWVPGSQWAPSWVSWRSSGNHVGWAPLPPETIVYQENRWDSTVDVTFGIGASCFVFVETRHFGNSIHHHCLPYDRNSVFIQQTTNITHIHVQNRRIICGGPTYGDVQKQVDRPLPFYRLQMDRQNPVRGSSSMRPRIEGNRLHVNAPNLENPWNRGLRPEKIRGSIDDIQVVRNSELRPEITERFRKVREEEKIKADQTIRDLGGEEQLRRQRLEQRNQNQLALQENRRRDAALATQPDREVAPSTRPSPVPNGGRPQEDPRHGIVDTRPTQTSKPSQSQPETRDNPPSIQPPSRRPIVSDKKPNPPPPGTRIVDPHRDTFIGGRQDDKKPNPTPPGERIVDPHRNSFPGSRQKMEKPNTAGVTEKRPGNGSANPRPQPETVTNPNRANEEQARQQQLAAQRQREAARQQQAEEARRGQAREQQMEAQRQREAQERARQQQAEENRREQARQQQLEMQRQRQREQQAEAQREQARQQQQERARQEQQERARQEQQERARQEQQERARQQQMEEARREQARQQQQDAQRQREQQERQRQQQPQEERRGRNR